MMIVTLYYYLLILSNVFAIIEILLLLLLLSMSLAVLELTGPPSFLGCFALHLAVGMWIILIRFYWAVIWVIIAAIIHFHGPADTASI